MIHNTKEIKFRPDKESAKTWFTKLMVKWYLFKQEYYKYTWLDNFMNRYFFDILYDTKHGIKNFWAYKGVIWQDRNWDHTYILSILKFKLEKQAKSISKWDNHEGAQEDSKRMMECVELLDKLMNFDYDDEENNIYRKQHLEKYGKLIFKRPEEKKPFYDMDEIAQHERPAKTKAEKKKEWALLLKCHRLADKNKRADKKKLFDIIENHIEEWWD